MESPFKITLIIRSYRRPEYLKKTILSVIKSDAMELCNTILIWDDSSKDIKVLNILKYAYRTKKIKIKISNVNEGCKMSYISALKYVRDVINPDIFITIDNDVIVKPFFVTKLISQFKRARELYDNYNFILTGFRPTNAHLEIINNLEGEEFYEKPNFGGINYMFHKTHLPFVLKHWEFEGGSGPDHNVAGMSMKMGYKMLCLKVSVLNHIGKNGLHSNGNCDFDKNFSSRFIKRLEK